MGGLWAVVVTDYIQFVILTIGVAVLFPIVFAHMGGLVTGFKIMAHDAPAGFFLPVHAPFSPMYIAAFYLLIVISYNGNWAFAQKFYSVRDERDAKKAGVLATVLKIVGPPLFLLPAMAARHLMPELMRPPNSPQYAYAALSLKYLPPGLLGLMIAAMFSATMSTLSGDFNVVASVLTEDLYRRLVNPVASDKKLMLVGRLSTLFAGLVTLLIGTILVETARTGLFEVMMTLFSLFVGPMLIPMLAGLLSRRVTWRGAGDGNTISTDLRILVRPPRSDIHPRLYFGPRDRSGLIARTHDSKLGALWDQLLSMANKSRNTGDIAEGGKIFQLLDARYLLPTLPGYFDFLNRGSDRLLYNSVDAYVTSDPAARSVAKSTLLEIARWDTWTPPWFEAHGQHTYYPAGELATSVAFAYDLLHGDLSGSERNFIRHALIERSIKPVYREYVLDNRIMANTSNWIGHTVGGAILALLAITDGNDDPELNTYLGGLLMKLEDHMAASYLSDGSYGEGISYQEFDLKTLTLALTALQRVYGIDYWNRTYVKDSLEYPLFTLAQPIQDSLDMGDTHPPSGYSLAAILQHSRDPLVRCYYDRFEHRSITDFLFPPSQIMAKPPGEPVSRVFDEKGNAVFRTGWDPDDAILLYRAGPTFNHNHADQGQFLLRAFGENLATEAGYTDYYKDPYYANYFSEAPGHNTILIDGNPASQEIADTAQFRALTSYPRITDSITTQSYDALGSELSSVSRGRLKSYTRRIVFLKPNYVVVYDDIVATKPQTRFDWLLHVEDRNGLELSPTGTVYRAEKAAMGVRTLQPATTNAEVEGGHLPVALFNPVAPKGIPTEPGILDIASRASGTSIRFLVLLTLGRIPKEIGALNSAVQSVSGEGCTGIHIGDTDVLFRRREDPFAQYEDWRTDARAWTSSGSLISGELVSSMKKAAQSVFQSDRPVNFASIDKGGETRLVISTKMPATVRFYTGFVPAPAPGVFYSKQDGTIRIQVGAGTTEFVFVRVAAR